MTPFVILTSRPVVLTGLALGPAANLPVRTQIYCCSESGQATCSDHPYDVHIKPMPSIGNTLSATDQKIACERASAEAAGVQRAETACRRAQAAEDAREVQMTAQTAEQTRCDQRQKVVATQEGVHYCHYVYVGPLPYP